MNSSEPWQPNSSEQLMETPQQIAERILASGKHFTSQQLLNIIQKNHKYQRLMGRNIYTLENMLEANDEKRRVVWQMLAHINTTTNKEASRASTIAHAQIPTRAVFSAPWFIDDNGEEPPPNPDSQHFHTLFSKSPTNPKPDLWTKEATHVLERAVVYASHQRQRNKLRLAWLRTKGDSNNRSRRSNSSGVKRDMNDDDDTHTRTQLRPTLRHRTGNNYPVVSDRCFFDSEDEEDDNLFIISKQRYNTGGSVGDGSVGDDNLDVSWIALQYQQNQALQQRRQQEHEQQQQQLNNNEPFYAARNNPAFSRMLADSLNLGYSNVYTYNNTLLAMAEFETRHMDLQTYEQLPCLPGNLVEISKKPTKTKLTVAKNRMKQESDEDEDGLDAFMSDNQPTTSSSSSSYSSSSGIAADGVQIYPYRINWDYIAKHYVKAGRTGIQCYQMWLNHLDVHINKNRWTYEEDEALLVAVEREIIALHDTLYPNQRVQDQQASVIVEEEEEEDDEDDEEEVVIDESVLSRSEVRELKKLQMIKQKKKDAIKEQRMKKKKQVKKQARAEARRIKTEQQAAMADNDDNDDDTSSSANKVDIGVLPSLPQGRLKTMAPACVEILATPTMINWVKLASGLNNNRSIIQTLIHYQRKYNSILISSAKFTADEDTWIRTLVSVFGVENWYRITTEFPAGRNSIQLQTRWKRSLDPELTLGRWTMEDDLRLILTVKAYSRPNTRLPATKKPSSNSTDISGGDDENDDDDGVLSRAVTVSWTEVSRHIPGRVETQCRERYVQVLSRKVAASNASKAEVAQIKSLVSTHGYNWSAISKIVKNRTSKDVLRIWLANATEKERNKHLRFTGELRANHRVYTTEASEADVLRVKEDRERIRRLQDALLHGRVVSDSEDEEADVVNNNDDDDDDNEEKNTRRRGRKPTKK